MPKKYRRGVKKKWTGDLRPKTIFEYTPSIGITKTISFPCLAMDDAQQFEDLLKQAEYTKDTNEDCSPINP